MFCTNCGQKIPDGAAFCPNCGAKVSAPEAPGPAFSPPTDSASPAAESHPPKTPQATGSPLEAIVGKKVPYYMAEFHKIDAGQKTCFNWAGFFIGPYLCLYRHCFTLFKKYYLLNYILFFAGTLLEVIGLPTFSLTLIILGIVLLLAAGVLTLVNSIRLGKNLNREYYHHCQQQLAKPEGARKTGVSIKNVLVFVLVLVLVYGFCSILMMPSSAEEIREGYNDEAARIDMEREAASGNYGDFSAGADSGSGAYLSIELSYDIVRYSTSATPEDGLNALIDQINAMDVPTIPQSAINHYIEAYALDPSSVLSLAAYQSNSEMIRYSVFAPYYYSYEYYGPKEDLNPSNPNHVYTISDDGWKSDAELSDREFEQKYGLYCGYCDDFGRDTTGTIPTDPS